MNKIKEKNEEGKKRVRNKGEKEDGRLPWKCIVLCSFTAQNAS